MAYLTLIDKVKTKSSDEYLVNRFYNDCGNGCLQKGLYRE